jgi:hypothetical protein
VPNALVVIVSIFSHDLSVHGNNKHKWGHWIRSSFFCNPQASPDWNEETRNLNRFFFLLLCSPSRSFEITAAWDGDCGDDESRWQSYSSVVASISIISPRDMCQRADGFHTYICTYGKVLIHLKPEWSSFPRGDSHTPEAVKERRDGVREGESIVEIERRRKETAFSNSSMIIHFVFPSLIWLGTPCISGRFTCTRRKLFLTHLINNDARTVGNCRSELTTMFTSKRNYLHGQIIPNYNQNIYWRGRVGFFSCVNV